MLNKKQIFVVEDEYMIAHDLVHELEALGATIIGPCATVPKALKMLNEGRKIDMAVLDISLRDTLVYDVADRLAERGIPIVFATGFDAGVIPARYQMIPRCEKPIQPGAVGSLVAKVLAG